MDNARFISSVISKRRCDYESLEPSPKLRKLIESLPPLQFLKPTDLTDDEYAAMRRKNNAEIEENLQDRKQHLEAIATAQNLIT